MPAVCQALVQALSIEGTVEALRVSVFGLLTFQRCKPVLLKHECACKSFEHLVKMYILIPGSLGGAKRYCISNKLLRDADTGGPKPILCIARTQSLLVPSFPKRLAECSHLC